MDPRSLSISYVPASDTPPRFEIKIATATTEIVVGVWVTTLFMKDSDSQFDSHRLGQGRMRGTQTETETCDSAMFGGADSFLATSHIGNADSTPAGINQSSEYAMTRFDLMSWWPNRRHLFFFSVIGPPSCVVVTARITLSGTAFFCAIALGCLCPGWRRHPRASAQPPALA